MVIIIFQFLIYIIKLKISKIRHSFSMAVRDGTAVWISICKTTLIYTEIDISGLWAYQSMPPCIGPATMSPHTASHLDLDIGLGISVRIFILQFHTNWYFLGPGRDVIPSLVHVEFHLPFKIDGVLSQVQSGIFILFFIFLSI